MAASENTKLVPAKTRKGEKLQNIYVNRETGIYYVNIYREGKRLFKSLDTSVQDLAVDKSRIMIAEWIKGGMEKPKPGIHVDAEGLTVGTLCDAFAESRRKGARLPDGHKYKVSKGTLKNSLYAASHIKGLFGHMLVESITEPWWNAWYKKEGQELETDLDRVKRHLTQIFNFGLSDGKIKTTPKFMTPKSNQDDNDHSREVFSDDEIRLLYRIKDPVILLLVRLCLENGLRPFEAKRLKWANVDIKNKTLNIANGIKTKPSRHIYMTATTAEALAAYKETSGNSKWLFPRSDDAKLHCDDTFWFKRWNHAIAEVNKEVAEAHKGKGQPVQIGEEKTAYWMRHTFITRAIHVDKKPTQDVSQHCGVSEATLKKHYCHGKLAHIVGMPSTGDSFAKLGSEG